MNLLENKNNRQKSALRTHKCAHCGGRRKTGKDAAKSKSEAWGESDNDGGYAACAGDMFPLERVFVFGVDEYFEVVSYGTIYGRHPSQFNFDAPGQMIPCTGRRGRTLFQLL